MSLTDAIMAELPFLRQEAEARMLDTFDIGVPTGAMTYDPDANGGTGGDVEVVDARFTTPGRVKSASLTAHQAEAGGRTVASVVRELHIPVNSGAVPVGAIAVCTAIHATSDPTLLGARLKLTGPAPGSQTTARRLEVEEILT